MGRSRKGMTLEELASDPTARVVTPEEAERLEARNREIDVERAAVRIVQAEERRQRREAATASRAAKQARLAPYRAAILALAPGGTCEIPRKEYALVYRLCIETGRRFSTRAHGQMLTVTCADLGAAEGLL